MIMKEEEEAIKKVKGEALKEKDNPRAFIFPIRLEDQVNENALADTGSDINTMPYRIYKQLGREEMKKVDRGITMINHTQVEAMGILTNVLCQVGVTTLIAKFLILDIPIDRDAPIVVGRGFLRCNNEAKSRYNTKLTNLLPRHIYSPCVVNWDVLNGMGCDGEIDDMLRIKLREAESNEEIFTYVAWIRAFNIKEPIYAELWHEFYSTYEFDEVCADDELQSKKIIKFRLGGRAHNLTLLEFARRLGLYHADELEEDGFDVYFQGGLRSDEHFNAQEYWLSISRDENLGLSRNHASTIKNPILRVIHKMITYGLCQRTTGYDKIQKNDLWLLSMFEARHQNGYANVAWLIARWMKRKGVGTQRESQICCRQFIMKIARKTRVLTDVMLRSLSFPIYCRYLDTITLRELIDSEGRLIPENPQLGVPRVGIPRPLRTSMQDLYDRMGSMEIRQEAIERMEYMQSYHWDRYQGVFEHMAGIYNVPLQGAYNPLGYAQPSYEKVGHLTRDCNPAVPATVNQRAPVLKNQNHGHKPVNLEARGKAYAIGRGDANPGSNVVTGTFLLNNHYASVLFDSGADRSFVSTTFSTLLDVILDTLDASYAVELADVLCLEAVP
ncbi:retrotransposon ORF1 [Tanacetum coccineum]